MTSNTRKIVPWIAVAAWAGFIFFMSAHTGSDLNQGDGLAAQIKQWLVGVQASLLGSGVDLVSPAAHFSEYLVFGALLYWAFAGKLPWSLAFVVAVLCASAYGVTDEFHQLFVPDRACDPVDWVVDTLGATLGVTLLALVLKRSQAQ